MSDLKPVKKLLLFISLLLATSAWGENSLDKITEGETTGTIGELSVELYGWGDGDITGTWGEEDVELYNWGDGTITGTIGEQEVDLYDWGDGSFTGSLEDEDLDLFHWFDQGKIMSDEELTPRELEELDKLALKTGQYGELEIQDEKIQKR